jgi:NIMA-interacting peptidyl-prolyl cis-trans isomerase 1
MQRLQRSAGGGVSWTRRASLYRRDLLYDLLAVRQDEGFSSRSGVNHEGERDDLAGRRLGGLHVRHPIQAPVALLCPLDWRCEAGERAESKSLLLPLQPLDRLAPSHTMSGEVSSGLVLCFFRSADSLCPHSQDAAWGPFLSLSRSSSSLLPRWCHTVLNNKGTRAEIRFSNTRKRPYFYNSESQQSCWEVPPALTDADLTQLPGAQHLSYSSTADSDAGSSNNNNKIRASHLLIKHSGSRRPSSWREKEITRSKQDAIEILKQHQKLLKDAVDLRDTFAKLASTESDCSSARDGGDLGTPSVPPSRICPPDSHMRTYLQVSLVGIRCKSPSRTPRSPSKSTSCPTSVRALILAPRFLNTAADTPNLLAVSTDSGVHLILRTA